MSYKIKTTRNTAIQGKPVKAGKVITVPDECSEKDAKALIINGKAERFEGKGGDKSGDEAKDSGKVGDK